MAISYLAVDLNSHPFVADSAIDPNGWPARVFPAIHVFGRTYDGHIEPTLNFDLLKIGTPVLAPFDGTILDVQNQPASCDTEMYFIDANNDTQRHLSYDHVIPLDKFRTRGATFKAGEVIASIGAWECTQSFGRVEMMVVVQPAGASQPTSASCPLLWLDPTRKATLTAQIAAVLDWWNTLRTPSAYSTQEKAPNGLCSTESAPV